MSNGPASVDPPVGGLASRTLSGAAWTSTATVIALALQLGYAAVMSRLLHPRDFGVVAMAGIFLRFGSYFAEMGVGTALVQKQQLTPQDTQAAFGSSLVLGFAFAFAIALAAPLAGVVFHNPAVVPIARGLGVTLAFGALGIPSRAILQREFRFRALALTEIASFSLFLIAGVTMAVLGFGVWSLVGASIAQSLSQSILAYAVVGHTLRPAFPRPELRALYSFGGRYSVISFLEFVGGNLDTVAVGRFSGATLLGQYGRATMIISLPFEKASASIARVVFPAFSRVQSERARMRDAFLSITRLIATVLVPTALGVSVASVQIVRTLLGPGWAEAAGVLPLLAVAYLFYYLSMFAGLVCDATAHLNQKLVLQAGYLGLLSCLLLASRGHGLRYFAGAVAISMFTQHIAYALLMARILRLTHRDYLYVYVAPTATGLFVLLGVVGITHVADSLRLPHPIALVAQAGVGGLLMALALWKGPLRGVRRELHSKLTDAWIQSPQGPNSGQALIIRVLAIGDRSVGREKRENRWSDP